MINADNSIKVDGLEKSIIDKCKQRIIAIAVIFFVSFIVVNIKLIEVSKPLKVKDYSDIDGAYGNDRGASAHNQIILHNVLNITDVATQKIKFKCSTGNNITIQGSNDVFGTKIRFIKLCASV